MSEVVLVLLMIVGTALAAVPATIAAGIGTRGIPEGTIRTLVRLALVTPIAVVAGIGGTLTVVSLRDGGSWQCLVCTMEERQSRIAGVVYWRESCPPTPFETWYERTVAREHEHDWYAVGCHFGSVIACHRGLPGNAYFVRLPKLADQKLARALATHVLEPKSSDREGMLLATKDGPFARIPDEDLGTAYSAWLERHPEWR